MKYNQIIKILQENFSTNDFAYGELTPNDEFKCSEEVERLKEEWNAAYEAYRNHPGYNSSCLQDETYNVLLSAFRNVKSPDALATAEFLNHLGLGEIKEVEQKGGEGEGDEWYSIKYFPKHQLWIKIDGWYTSHHGTDFDESFDSCCKEVIPVEKTVIVYDPK